MLKDVSMWCVECGIGRFSDIMNTATVFWGTMIYYDINGATDICQMHFGLLLTIFIFPGSLNWHMFKRPSTYPNCWLGVDGWVFNGKVKDIMLPEPRLLKNKHPAKY